MWTSLLIRATRPLLIAVALTAVLLTDEARPAGF